MPLPKIATPTYELELPSTEKTVNYSLKALQAPNQKIFWQANADRVAI